MSSALFKEYEPHTVNVDSADYVSRDAPLISVLPGIPNCEAFYVESLQIPFSYFIVDYSNNVLVVYIGANADGTPKNNTVRYTIYLEPGTFTSDTFPTSFARVCNTSYDGTNYPYLGGVNKSTYNGSAWGSEAGSTELSTTYGFTAFPYAGDSKITFYMSTTGAAVPFWVDCTKVAPLQTPDTPAQMLGLSTTAILYSGGSTSAIIISNNGSATLTTYWAEAPYCYTFAGPAKIYIRSSTISSMQPNGTETTAITSQTGTAGTSQNIIGAIDVNQNYGGIISYINTFPQPIPLSMSATFSSFDLYFTLGTRTTFSDGGSSRSSGNTTWLQFQGQSFQIRLKFLCRKMSSSSLQPSGPDRVYRSLPNIAGSQEPQDKVYRNRDVGTNGNSGPIRTNRTHDRNNAYPTQRPRK
jgi:hypothetical protein